MTALTVSYDPQSDAAYIRFSASKIKDSQEIAEGIVFDYDEEGRIVGMEVLDARAHLPAEVLEKAA